MDTFEWMCACGLICAAENVYTLICMYALQVSAEIYQVARPGNPIRTYMNAVCSYFITLRVRKHNIAYPARVFVLKRNLEGLGSRRNLDQIQAISVGQKGTYVCIVISVLKYTVVWCLYTLILIPLLHSKHPISRWMRRGEKQLKLHCENLF